MNVAGAIERPHRPGRQYRARLAGDRSRPTLTRELAIASVKGHSASVGVPTPILILVEKRWRTGAAKAAVRNSPELGTAYSIQCRSCGRSGRRPTASLPNRRCARRSIDWTPPISGGVFHFITPIDSARVTRRDRLRPFSDVRPTAPFLGRRARHVPIAALGLS
jgi:hypothetical protein